MPFISGYLILINISEINMNVFTKYPQHSTEHETNFKTLLSFLLNDYVEIFLWYFLYGHAFNYQSIYMDIL